jgi:hypothetical protein
MDPSNPDDECYDSFDHRLPPVTTTLVRGLSEFSALASSLAGRAVGAGFSVASDYLLPHPEEHVEEADVEDVDLSSPLFESWIASAKSTLMYYLEKGCNENMTVLRKTHSDNLRMLDEAHAEAKSSREASQAATLAASSLADEYEEAKKKVFHFKETAHNSIHHESKKIALANMIVHPKTQEDEPCKHWSLAQIQVDSNLSTQEQWDALERGTLYGITLKYHRLFNLKDTLGWKDVTAASRKRGYQELIEKLQRDMAANETAVAAEQEAASGGAEEEGDSEGPAKKRKLG